MSLNIGCLYHTLRGSTRFHLNQVCQECFLNNQENPKLIAQSVYFHHNSYDCINQMLIGGVEPTLFG